jgi:predicted 3-demethylubiquinone-9 3-methyltransferase (glyoxalase superfamily)
MQKITPFLWFDNQAEDAMNFYTSIFPESEVLEVSRYPEGGPMPGGVVMTARFKILGQEFVALNGGPEFKFTEAVSFMVPCKDQQEVDYYWDKLLEGGGVEDMCGWLKDRYGLSWQITPTALMEMVGSKDAARGQKAMEAMLQMKKIDIAAIEAAYNAVSMTNPLFDGAAFREEIADDEAKERGEDQGEGKLNVKRAQDEVDFDLVEIQGDERKQDQRSQPHRAQFDLRAEVS